MPCMPIISHLLGCRAEMPLDIAPGIQICTIPAFDKSSLRGPVLRGALPCRMRIFEMFPVILAIVVVSTLLPCSCVVFS